MGNTPADAVWYNAGPLNVATMVTVNGEFQNMWDADTKVNVTDYATNGGGYGLVKLRHSNYGLKVNTDGTLTLNPTSKYNLETQSNQFEAVSPAFLAYGVKQSLINPNKSEGTPANWTNDDQKKAQNTLGIINSEGAPSISTPGYIGQIYIDTLTGISYQCFAIGLSGEGNPDGIVTSDCYMQTYSDTLNKLLYVANSPSNRTRWTRIGYLGYADQTYSWSEIYKNNNLIGYAQDQKSLKVNVIQGAGGGAAEEIILGESDRTIDFRDGSSYGLRIDSNIDSGKVVLKPYPGSNNTRVDKTDLGTAEHPFRDLYLTGNVLLNGQSMPHVYKHLLTFDYWGPDVPTLGSYQTKVVVLSTSPDLIRRENEVYDPMINFENKVFAVDTTYRPLTESTQTPIIPLSLDKNGTLTGIANGIIKTVNHTAYNFSVYDQLI